MKKILVHFDVSDEYVLLETFVASANAAKRMVDALNQTYFDGQVEIELVVLPPEAGSLKQYIGVVLKLAGKSVFVLAALMTILESDHGVAVSEELFGKPSSEIIREIVRGWKQQYEETFLDEENEAEVIEEIAEGDIQEKGKVIIEEIVTRSAMHVFEMSRTELARLNLPEEQKFEFAQAQAELFSQSLTDQNVRGIGFSEENDFPIPRSGFAERAVRPTAPKEKEPDEEWLVSLRTIRVTSPNFDQDDQVNRKWKGRLDTGAQLLFEVEDEEFWLKLKHSEIEFGESTVIKVQIASRVEDGRVRNHKVLRVLAVDDAELAVPLTDDGLAAALGAYKYDAVKPGTPDLFDR